MMIHENQFDRHVKTHVPKRKVVKHEPPVTFRISDPDTKRKFLAIHKAIGAGKYDETIEKIIAMQFDDMKLS